MPDSTKCGSIALLGAVALVGAACSGDDSSGDAERFCGEVQANTAALVTAPASADEIDGFLDEYRRIGELAPLAIEPHWQALVLNYETASTVEPADPESVQRAVGRGLRDRALGRRRQGLAARQLQRRPRPGGDDRAAGSAAAADDVSADRRRRQAASRISPRRVLTSSHRPYSTACSAVNQRSRSESAWICSSVLPEWRAISSAMRRFV